MRLAYTIALASLLATPAMAADIVVTTPGVVATPPGIVVTPGGPNSPQRDLNQAMRHEEKADRALDNGNYGAAEKQEMKADRDIDKAQR